jgi:DNA-directed RNA polymerase subunit RPC12/RpoP
MQFSKKLKNKIKELISICKSAQGEYLPAYHGSGSWATTYSNDFINASCELYLILKKSGSCNPIDELSGVFKDAGIRSCRGSVFLKTRVEYLYSSHLCSRLKQMEEQGIVAQNDEKVKCLYCDKKVLNLMQHVSQAHLEKWLVFSQENQVDLQGKTRCPSCGSFLKNMIGHNEKCPRYLDNIAND